MGLAVKLTLAFAAVAVAAVALTAFLISRATDSAFGVYVTHIRGMGTMMGGMMHEMMGAPEGEFLTTVNQSLWLAGGIAVLAAVGLGLLLARQMAMPLRGLTVAARRIAGGALDERVPVATRDEIGELAASFNAMAEALARNETLRRNMIADIAHELRTPLSVLQGKLEAIQDGVAQPTPREVASLHEEVMLLARLVADLRTLSLADAGQLELRREPVDLAAVAQRVVRAMRAQSEGKGVALTLDLQSGGLSALADPDRVVQVMENLLSNAIRHTPTGGRVDVRVSARDGQVRLTVADSGPGIPSDDLPHVFERFYRADRSRSRASGGSGLGLAIVRHLMEAMGGRVDVESQPGRGATFHCTFNTGQGPPVASADARA
ncbi:MAG: ATP-binding protein [Dehalococcoidia bacterium]|nr:ATP-binding protein [Dehalococcoidia bacterium]